MTLCPIAVVAGCSKCPVVGICPLKTVLGDAAKAPPAEKRPPAGASSSAKPKKKQT